MGCRRVARRRHSPPADRAAIARRLGRRSFIFCDLHMHTDHSGDCATPVDVLLETAKQRGLGAIAITDHNEISGALEARERADGIQVIVSEEVKTAHEGEVIGLFIEDKIPRGMSLEETIDAIHEQGGLAYVPHPFDRLRSVPDYEHLVKVVDRIDVLEVFNANVAVPSFNEEAVRFAAKYRIVAGAGSDSHVPQGLGRVMIKMRDFRGPDEFLESLRDADILRKRKSLIYLKSLKLLQRARPPRGRARAGGG
jgi:predicted metal-dependent phosphoesterase TrpH